MAYTQTYGDLSYFRPSESYYATSDQALRAAKTGALEKASYLSEMDAAYAQLQQQLDIEKMEDKRLREIAALQDATQRRGISVQAQSVENARVEAERNYGLQQQEQQRAMTQMMLGAWTNQQQLGLQQRDQNLERMLELGTNSFSDKEISKYLGGFERNNAEAWSMPKSGLITGGSKGGTLATMNTNLMRMLSLL